MYDDRGKAPELLGPYVAGHPTPLSVVLALAATSSVVTCFSVIGSDALWLSAIGDAIRLDHQIPAGIPFAAAPSDRWVNTTALGQVIFSVLHEMGSVGLLGAQVLTATLTLGILVAAAHRAGAGGTGIVTALLLVVLGCAIPLLVARAQMLSLVPYAALIVLLRREHARPSQLIWAAVPLVALWGNLHGAVLAGVAVLGCYLVFSRLREEPWVAVGVGLSSLIATCLNPGLLGAPQYYLGVFGGAATTDDSGMWSRLSLSNPLDLMFVVASICLAVGSFRHRRPLWEYAAALGLAGATLTAARHGIWLLLFLLVPAALASSVRSPRPGQARGTSRMARVAACAAGFIVVAALLAARAPSFRAADDEAAQLTDATRGEVVLVAEPLAEALAVAGATVWVSNPLDAFPQADQTAYLAFLSGSAERARLALDNATVVVALPDSAQARSAQAAGLSRVTPVGRYLLLRRQ